MPGPQIRTEKDDDGVFERVVTTYNKQGLEVKTIEKVKTEEVKERVLKRVVARSSAAKFGKAAVSNQNVTTVEIKFVAIEHPDDQLAEEDQGGNNGAGTLTEFIKKTAERKEQREAGIDTDYDRSSAAVGLKSSDSSDRYVPPSARGGAVGAGATMDDRGSHAEITTTIRVSNLTKEATDMDVKELFLPFGQISRVSVPRADKKYEDPVTKNIVTRKEVKGFAYVSYYHRADAENAMRYLQGHAYDLLILRLEWANPQRQDGGSGGGDDRRYKSGYGERLAQDTKEKVSYASNLTGNS